MYYTIYYIINIYSLSTDIIAHVLQPTCTNVCFWYIPPSLRNQLETAEWGAKLGQVSKSNNLSINLI